MLVGTTNLNTTLNLTYVLTDVVETLLYDLRSEMGKQGYELRHDAKRNFNTAIAAIRKLKQDVDKTQFSTQENFGNDSDCLLAFIRLLVDRCGDDDKKMFAFYNYIKRHPSQLGLDLSDEKVRLLIFSKVTRSWISYENTPKHPPSPRSEHLILPGGVCDSGPLDGYN